MRRNFPAFTLLLAALATPALAQTRAGGRASADSSSSVAARGRQLDIASGTRVSGELQSALDVGRARVGDRVVLKTTEAIRSGGRTVVKRGASLVGHVADVQRRARGSAASSLTVIFDRLESGSLSAPVTATIDSVTRGSARARAGDDDVSMDTSARSSSSARTSDNSSSGGGLLGGVTGAVGNTVGGVTGAAGDVVGSTTETLGNTTRGLGDTLGRIQITQSAGVNADAGTTLSLTGGNLRLEKGTAFHLTLAESAGVGNNR
jgi:hypothetical protein